MTFTVYQRRLPKWPSSSPIRYDGNVVPRDCRPFGQVRSHLESAARRHRHQPEKPIDQSLAEVAARTLINGRGPRQLPACIGLCFTSASGTWRRNRHDGWLASSDTRSTKSRHQSWPQSDKRDHCIPDTLVYPRRGEVCLELDHSPQVDSNPRPKRITDTISHAGVKWDVVQEGR